MSHESSGIPLIDLPRQVRAEAMRLMDEEEYAIDLVLLTSIRDLRIAIDNLLEFEVGLRRISPDSPKARRFMGALRVVALDVPGNISLPSVGAAIEIVRDFLPFTKKFAELPD